MNFQYIGFRTDALHQLKCKIILFGIRMKNKVREQTPSIKATLDIVDADFNPVLVDSRIKRTPMKNFSAYITGAISIIVGCQFNIKPLHNRSNSDDTVT